MLIDTQLELSLAQAVTVTAFATNPIDLKGARDIGAGRPLFLYVQCDQDAAAAGAATVEFQVVTDNADTFPSPVVLWTSGPIGKAALLAGKFELKQALPIGAAYEGFLTVNYVVGTGPLTAGAFTAAIVADVPNRKSYPRGYTIA